MKLESVLKKQKLTNYFSTSKTDNLNVTKNKIGFNFTGKLLQVLFVTRYTKFDIAEYVKVSKKQRTNISEKKIKDVLQYSFIGYCFNLKRQFDRITTSFSLRNILDGFPIEMIFPLYSPVIIAIGLKEKFIPKKATKFKYFFLRRKPNPESLFEFNYVLRKKEIIKKKKIKTIKKL